MRAGEFLFPEIYMEAESPFPHPPFGHLLPAGEGKMQYACEPILHAHRANGSDHQSHTKE